MHVLLYIHNMILLPYVYSAFPLLSWGQYFENIKVTITACIYFILYFSSFLSAACIWFNNYDQFYTIKIKYLYCYHVCLFTCPFVWFFPVLFIILSYFGLVFLSVCLVCCFWLQFYTFVWNGLASHMWCIPCQMLSLSRLVHWSTVLAHFDVLCSMLSALILLVFNIAFCSSYHAKFFAFLYAV